MPNPYSPGPRTVTFDQQKVVDGKLDAIISSVRPFGQSPSYDILQKEALKSWAQVSRTIILFNLPTDLGDFQQPGILFANPDKNPPSIKYMLDYLKTHNQEEIVALVNSDVVLGPQVGQIPKVALVNSLGLAWACTSERYMTDPQRPGFLGAPIDKGLDFFCTTVRIWTYVAENIPGVLTIGRPIWDTWLNSYWRMHIDPSRYFDITPWICVFHPTHEEHFRLQVTDDGGVEAVVQNMPGPGGLPRRKLSLLK